MKLYYSRLAGMSSKTFATKRNGIAMQRSPQVQCKRIPTFVSRRRCRVRKHKRHPSRESKRKIKATIEQLRSEIVEIEEEQQCIKEGQMQVRNKYEEIVAKREQLKRETEVIAKQSASIQLRLNLMFGIVKARGQNDSVLVDQLTQSLRDLVAKQNEQMQ